MSRKLPTFETALKRFLLGQCPLCEKGKGDPKGVEIRPNMGDSFCHSCRKSWTPTTVLKLEHMLSTNGRVPLEIAPSPLDPLSLAEQSPSFFQRFFRWIAMLVGK